MSLEKLMPQKHVAVLTTVDTFGYASLRELALLLWANVKPASGFKSAQLAAKSLEKDGYICEKGAGSGKAGRVWEPGEKQAFPDKLYVLTRKGSRFLCHHFVELTFKASYDVETGAYLVRRPVMELAHVFARERGLLAIGARGLGHGVFELTHFPGLDALLVDPDGLTPAFGIVHVRTYFPAEVERVKKLLTLSVPILFAGGSRNPRVVAALAKLRAERAPAEQDMVDANRPNVPVDEHEAAKDPLKAALRAVTLGLC